MKKPEQSSSHENATPANQAILAIDLAALLRRVRDEARAAARDGAREGISEALRLQSGDAWLDSKQAATALGFCSYIAFKSALTRTPALAQLGTKLGRCWRFRRSDLEAWLARPPSPRAAPTALAGNGGTDHAAG